MPFVEGQSGNPSGHNGKKLFVDALHALISTTTEGDTLPSLPRGSTIAHRLAAKLVREALSNPKDPKTALAFIQEICDRAYGRPKQAIIGGDQDDKPLIPEKITIEFIDKPTLTDELK